MNTEQRRRQLGRILIVAQFAVLGYAVGLVLHSPVWMIGVALAGIPAATLVGSAGFRGAMRFVGIVQPVIAMICIRVFIDMIDGRWGSKSPFPELLFYIVLNVTVPLLVAALMPHRLRDAKKLDLPPGYEHLDRSHNRLSTAERLALILAVSLGIPTFMMGGLFLGIVLVPILFAGYWLVRFANTRRQSSPIVARHVRLKPKRTTAAQTSSYWTVNSDPFKADENKE